MKNFLLLLILLTTVCTFAQQTTITTIQVEPHKHVTNGAFFKSLAITASPYAEHIEGFNFEWGYTYSLKIEETKLENPPMDGSSLEYKLIKTLNKTKVADDYTFPLQLHFEVYLGPSNGEDTSPFKRIKPGIYTYFNDVEVEIPPVLESSFSSFLKNKKDTEGTFQVVGPNRIRLIAMK